MKLDLLLSHGIQTMSAVANCSWQSNRNDFVCVCVHSDSVCFGFVVECTYFVVFCGQVGILCHQSTTLSRANCPDALVLPCSASVD